MTFHLNRLYKGLATLRSDQVEKVIKKKDKLVIECNGETMTIPFEEIESSIISKSAPLPSKFYVGNTYRLVDFLWFPTK